MEHLRSSSTVCTDLAAALCTLAIPRHPERPLEVLVGDAEQTAFYFVGDSPCGDYSASTMIKAWSDRAFHAAHPRHPLSYIKSGLINRDVLLDYAKGGTPCGIVSRGDGARLQVVRILPDHRCPPVPLRATTPHDAAANDSLRTESLELAAALLACGIPLWAPLSIARAAGRLTFFFAPSDPTGAFPTAALMLAWQNPEWYLAHPEHPLAYLYCAFENRRRLLAEVRSHTPTACMLQRNDLPAFLSLNAPPELEAIFYREFEALN